ncbi:hypothetical protein GJAV_G00231300 [Gymnothorax javanicus]|nr:hypothetical protein GJAV_G00231300 [Gymnothorax javanicus]
MDASVVINSRVKAKDMSRAVVIAVTASSIFDLGEEAGLDRDSTANDDEPFKMGRAFPFIKAIKRVNEDLLEMDPEETPLFDVILVLTNHSPHTRSRIETSVEHYGLEVGRFCFCGPEDFAEPLQSNNVKLFLSTDRNEVCKAWQRGVPAALLYSQDDPDPSDQLRVLFMGDLLGLTDDPAPLLTEMGFSKAQQQHMMAVKDAMMEFAECVGKMRSRFGWDGSPLCTLLMVAWGPRDVCARALKMLRSRGLDMDQAFCLAGAPGGPILAHVRPTSCLTTISRAHVIFLRSHDAATSV